ncbi:luxR family transcriptional regulatory protein [Rhodoferax antarcticus ANT.BR]|uniref:LuxR family transcriptional regulatory protein n=1 Tax=Rhodoferax antarcticus ANT.BR TaxID=1111071 RepID=A0A1Q8YAG4_9BURK|nr:hypothetical protein RA876_13090 [Rhodoferax antarcticus]OLP05041.1 luxR family transcriptional regulatory protein [Rhodoferax antarcticus ANT.BR]
MQQDARYLGFRLHRQTGDGEGAGDWLIVMREVSDAAVMACLGLGFRLTAREAEVLYWLVKGKTNRDIGEILGSSPATVEKHLDTRGRHQPPATWHSFCITKGSSPRSSHARIDLTRCEPLRRDVAAQWRHPAALPILC